MLERDDFVGFEQETGADRAHGGAAAPAARPDLRAAAARDPGDPRGPLRRGRASWRCSARELAILARDTSAAEPGRRAVLRDALGPGAPGRARDPGARGGQQRPAQPAWRAALSFLLCEIGRTAEAQAEVDRLGPRRLRGPAARPALHRRAGTAVRERLLPRRRRARGAAAPAARAVRGPQRGVCRWPPASARSPASSGWRAATYGDWDEATRRFDEAQGRRAAKRPACARCSPGSRSTRRACSRATDAGAATAALHEARALGAETGPRPSASAEERCWRRRRRRRADRAAPASPPRPLRRRADASLRREGDVWAFGPRGADRPGAPTARACATWPCCSATRASRSTRSTWSAWTEGGGPRGGHGAPAPRTPGSTSRAGRRRRRAARSTPQAKRAYKGALDELREELEEAEAFNDPERASRAREEIEFLGRELAGAVGLGRARPQGRLQRRARAGQRHARAAHAAQARRRARRRPRAGSCETTIRTGTFCAHEPDPRRPVTWTVEGG